MFHLRFFLGFIINTYYANILLTFPVQIFSEFDYVIYHYRLWYFQSILINFKLLVSVMVMIYYLKVIKIITTRNIIWNIEIIL